MVSLWLFGISTVCELLQNTEVIVKDERPLNEPQHINFQQSLFDDDYSELLNVTSYNVGRLLDLDGNAEAEMQLVERNRELQLLLDTMREVVLYFDRFGTIKQANLFAQRWLGAREFYGQSFEQLLPNWDDAARRQRDLMRVMHTGVSVWGGRESVLLDQRLYWFNVDKIPTTDLSGQVNGLMLVLTDITDIVGKEKALQESEARYRAYIANSSDAIWRYDIYPPVDTRLCAEQQAQLIASRARLAECNLKLAQLYGYASIAEILGQPLHRNQSLATLGEIREFVVSGYRLGDKEFSLIKPDRERLHLQTNALGIVENGYLTRAWGTTRDVTDKRNYLERMEFLANHDALTQLPNRALLARRVEEVLVGNKLGTQMALLLIDLDRFKEINDTLGHARGDQMLKQLGNRLQLLFEGSQALVARLGGDEFAVFLPLVDGREEALSVAWSVSRAISVGFDLDGFCIEISASIGISLCPDQAKDLSTLMRFADVAMYYAKSHFRGVAFYNADFDSHSTKRLELMGALGRAIREDQLILHFQPKIDLVSHHVYGFEALVRWGHPELGLILPSEFIPLAEMSTVIYAVTSWVLEQSIKQCKNWRNAGYAMSVAVNLSARNLMDERIVADLRRMLIQYDVPGSALELEITESMIMQDPNRALGILERINQLGITLSIDDFGTGYSSLAYLKRLPVQALKIDYSFIRAMLDDKQDQIIVNSTIHLAHNLGLQVVAEGVETQEVYDELVALGCNSAQGFFMGHPMPAAASMQWLEQSIWGCGLPAVAPRKYRA